MNNIHEKIKKLTKEITELRVYLATTEQIIKNLESKNRSQIQAKEKELEAWRQKLETCQQEKRKIDKEIKEKVKELENSELSNAEKQAKINRLLTENSAELEEVDKLLYAERGHYREIRDKLIGRLCEPCEGCRIKGNERSHLIEQNKQKDKKIIYLLGIIGIMLVLFFLFQIWLFQFAVPRYMRKIGRRMRVKI